jgi:hypothetical protein
MLPIGRSLAFHLYPSGAERGGRGHNRLRIIVVECRLLRRNSSCAQDSAPNNGSLPATRIFALTPSCDQVRKAVICLLS